MPRVVMPLSVLVTMQADAAFLHSGCCAGTTSRPANEKQFDGNGQGATSTQCQNNCWSQGGNVVTWDNGWCTCWKPQYMSPSTCGFATDAGNCGSDMTSASTYYNFWARSSEQQASEPETGLVLGGTKMGNGCCAGTTSHPKSDKLMDGPGLASTEADCNWKCWNAPHYGNVVTWDPVGNWCTCWAQPAMHPSSCGLVTDAGDCGSDMSTASTSYNTWSLSTEQTAPEEHEDLSLELGKTLGTGCCAGTTSHPASDKLFDGSPYTTAAACTSTCWSSGGNVVTWDPVGNWCTCWTPKGMPSHKCHPTPAAADCGSPMPTAITYYKKASLSTEQQALKEQVELKGATAISGCCNAVAQPASYKFCDGHGTPYKISCDSQFGVQYSLADCFSACQGRGGHVASFGPNNWCTCWAASFHSNQCTSSGSCGSDYQQWSSMYDGLFMADGNSTSGVDVIV